MRARTVHVKSLSVQGWKRSSFSTCLSDTAAVPPDGFCPAGLRLRMMRTKCFAECMAAAREIGQKKNN